MKKLLCMLLALTVVLVAFAGIASAEEAATWKIAIMTGTTSQGEEEFRAAEALKEKYPDNVITDTYPDQFMAEQETTIAKLTAFAADPDVKAIVMCQAVPGATPAFNAIREMGRDDILFIAGVPQEDPAVIAEAADIVMYADEIKQGDSIMETCANWGIDVFIHYSFPRHMAMELIVGRHDLMVENAAALGIEFVDVTAPDPTAEAGATASQQFILEDVPRKVEQYGKDTAFFCTNCGMQEPLIQRVLEEGAIFPQQCCPSPYHAYPGALGINVAGHEGDVQYMLDQITEKVVEGNNPGRMSTWAVPINMLEVEAGVRYAEKWIKGETNGRVDTEVLFAIINEIAGGEGKADVHTYIEKQEDGTEKEYENYFMILCDYYTFGEAATDGSDATDGADGADVTDGADGVDGADGADGAEGDGEQTPAA